MTAHSSIHSLLLCFRDDYLDTLKTIATTYGISENYIDSLLEEGFTTDDIEELIYCY
ncbi:MAG: hypothetical protein UE295_09970 [Acutalibacteraceae bacterium]|nr:hypothetical protein [Acutalibacteraceae bacterium]